MPPIHKPPITLENNDDDDSNSTTKFSKLPKSKSKAKVPTKKNQAYVVNSPATTESSFSIAQASQKNSGIFQTCNSESASNQNILNGPMQSLHEEFPSAEDGVTNNVDVKNQEQKLLYDAMSDQTPSAAAGSVYPKKHETENGDAQYVQPRVPKSIGKENATITVDDGSNEKEKQEVKKRLVLPANTSASRSCNGSEPSFCYRFCRNVQQSANYFFEPSSYDFRGQNVYLSCGNCKQLFGSLHDIPPTQYYYSAAVGVDSPSSYGACCKAYTPREATEGQYHPDFMQVTYKYGCPTPGRLVRIIEPRECLGGLLKWNQVHMGHIVGHEWPCSNIGYKRIEDYPCRCGRQCWRPLILFYQSHE